MANSRRRCRVCRRYGLAGEMVRTGLGVVCAGECVAEARKREQMQRAGRNASHQRSFNRGKKKPSGMKQTRHVIPEKVRRAVDERDRRRCRFCSTATTTMHHIHYLSEGGEDSIYNLITLCTEHHDLMHSDKGRWKPILLAWIWLTYTEDRWLTVLEAAAISVGRPPTVNERLPLR